MKKFGTTPTTSRTSKKTVDIDDVILEESQPLRKIISNVYQHSTDITGTIATTTTQDDNDLEIDEETLSTSKLFKNIDDWFQQSIIDNSTTIETQQQQQQPKVSPLLIFGQRGCGKTTTILNFFKQRNYRTKYWNKCYYKQGKKVLDEIRAIFSIKHHSVFYKTVYIFDDLDFLDINLSEIPYLFNTRIASPIIFIWNIAAKALKMMPLNTINPTTDVDPDIEIEASEVVKIQTGLPSYANLFENVIKFTIPDTYIIHLGGSRISRTQAELYFTRLNKHVGKYELFRRYLESIRGLNQKFWTVGTLNDAFRNYCPQTLLTVQENMEQFLSSGDRRWVDGLSTTEQNMASMMLHEIYPENITSLDQHISIIETYAENDRLDSFIFNHQHWDIFPFSTDAKVVKIAQIMGCGDNKHRSVRHPTILSRVSLHYSHFKLANEFKLILGCEREELFNEIAKLRNIINKIGDDIANDDDIEYIRKYNINMKNLERMFRWFEGKRADAGTIIATRIKKILRQRGIIIG